MRYFRWFIGTFFLCFFAACSSGHMKNSMSYNEVSQYPFRHNDFDYHMAWKTEQAGNDVVVSGLLKNVRYANVDSLDLWVYLLTSDGKTKVRQEASPSPQQSRQGEVVPFSIRLKNASINQGDLFRFIVHYKASEGDHEPSGIDWRSTFVVDAASGQAKSSQPPPEW